MKKELNTATNIGLGVNIFLFAIKAAIGVLSNSIAVISEAVNSLTDIISSLAIKYSVRISSMQPDHDHQFGHNAAQPIAAFIVAVFAFVVGIKIIEESVKRIIEPQATDISTLVYVVLGISIIIKIVLSRYQFKVGLDFGSPALKAASVDSLNDVLA
ncbi:MAG: cation diffusion facilitator family transporter, partial [Bacteroidetes bacterium]|nr:cation diffusion facilitator family transporter [Bacteroidota bacterium]